ncbi:ankyrin repeat and MYND domain-containing protein 2-like [Symsagittifera roscoffensis]|uniref:ankyrin repeat and MYND domain-containing protein 2-like n=1 Tax=Symsagittifera roscoffensis TaxID=84072 RepID=UPI00307C9884
MTEDNANAVESATTSESFQKALDFINSDNETEFFSLIRVGNVNLKEVDSHGTSILQHAAFRNRSNMVNYLIKSGCDVNDTKHEHKYTALHFAALSGNIETVSALLDAGAKKDEENSVKRTAAEMAAFTGQSHIASFINSYFLPTIFLHYTDPSVGTSLQCDKELALELHKLATSYNIHPVRLAMVLKTHIKILEKIAVSIAILECERDKQFKKENNEILSLKLHFIACLLKKVDEAYKLTAQPQEEKEKIEYEKWKASCDYVIKWLWKAEKKGATEDNRDRFVKSGLKSYPFAQNTALQQSVKTIASAEPGKETAEPIAVYMQILTGSHAATFMHDSHCVTCTEKLRNHLRCSRCKEVQYCDKKCQAIHWSTHKPHCKST